MNVDEWDLCPNPPRDPSSGGGALPAPQCGSQKTSVAAGPSAGSLALGGNKPGGTNMWVGETSMLPRNEGHFLEGTAFVLCVLHM